MDFNFLFGSSSSNSILCDQSEKMSFSRTIMLKSFASRIVVDLGLHVLGRLCITFWTWSMWCSFCKELIAFWYNLSFFCCSTLCYFIGVTTPIAFIVKTKLVLRTMILNYFDDNKTYFFGTIYCDNVFL